MALTVGSFVSLMNGFKNSTPIKIGLLTGDEIWEHNFTFQTKQDYMQFGLLKNQLEGCRFHYHEEV
jgi:hypothetical protein